MQLFAAIILQAEEVEKSRRKDVKIPATYNRNWQQGVEDITFCLNL